MFSMRFNLLGLSVLFAPAVLAREWTDATGHYTISAEIVAFNDSVIVLKKANDELISVPLSDLSEADQTHLKVKDADDGSPLGESTQKWSLRSGMRLHGRIIDFHQHDLIIQRRLGKVYVNNQRYENLPGMYQMIIPKIVSHFTKESIDGEKGLVAWAREQKGQPRKFRCDGFLVELADENLYCIPFFLFSDQTLEAFKPGWERWLAAKEDQQQKDQQSLVLQAQANAYNQEQQRTRQVQQLQLNIQAYDSGLFDLWEVAMYPLPGRYGMPLSVVVPAVNNTQAAEIAKQRNPHYRVGPMRVVRRRN